MDDTILLICSNPKLRTAARKPLEQAGYRLRAVDGTVLREQDLYPPLDLIIAPWDSLWTIRGYVGIDGRDGSREQIPIIVLAHSRDIKTVIGCLDLGAEDCLRIPFEPEELVGRVHACLRRRRSNGRVASELVAGPIVLDKLARSFRVSDQRVELAPSEFRLMAFFLENQGRAFTRAELLRRVWSPSADVAERTVDVQVRRLRRVLEPFGCEGMIQTVRKFGYRFSGRPDVRPKRSVPSFSMQEWEW